MNGETAQTYVQVLGLYLRFVYVTILSFVFVCLHGCETWAPEFKEEYRPRVFENILLRRIFGPKRDEVTG